MKIKVKLLRENSKMPTRKDKDDAGFDCYVSQFAKYNTMSKKIEDYSIEGTKEILLKQGNVICCKLGFSTEIPKGYYAAVVPRSGLALKHGITIVNSPGTIDAGYRGEWSAIVTNLKSASYKVTLGDKICQFILRKLQNVELIKSKSLEDSNRGDNGYGSSGKN